MRQRITDKDDFPNLEIYADDGPVFEIEFENPEPVPISKALITALQWLVAAAIGIGLIFFVSRFDLFADSPWINVLIIFSALGVPIFVWAIYFDPALGGPWDVNRRIALDYPRNELRIFKNDKLELTRKLDRLSATSIEDHPRGIVDRTNDPGAKPTQWVKTHCLVGWFGQGGSEKVFLVPRYEFPPEHSLFEVRQAIESIKAAVQKGQQIVEQGLSAAENVDTKEADTSGGIKPPLD